MKLKTLFTYAVLHSRAQGAALHSATGLGELSTSIIDLGYAQHAPTLTNSTSSGHSVRIYKNVRFANAPTGDLRFRKPDTNLPHVHGVQNGSVPWGRTNCIASAPAEVPFSGINGTTWGTEDCLFLDVYVPDGVKPGDKVPVLHWFFGSGYAFGSKDILFNPLGLFDRMFELNEGRFIFVTNNYRLGVPGWLFAPGQDMDGNAGAHDCLAAARWTSRYIERFGGNGEQITAMGQSAGAGILYYMMTMAKEAGPLPFHQAFISSPAVQPRRNVRSRQQRIFDKALAAANCTDLECLRALSTDQVSELNDKLINQTPSEGGGGNFGPSIGLGIAPDGHDFPGSSLDLLRDGAFRTEVKNVIIGTMEEEGMGLSDDMDMPKRFPLQVRKIMPTASNSTIRRIQDLYHPRHPAQLAWDWTTDVIFACHAFNMAQAVPERVRRYIMSQPPATHAQDEYYWFYYNMTTTPVHDADTAKQFQDRLLRFVQGRDPGQDWPRYGHGQHILNITDAFVATELPTELAHRCHVIDSAVDDLANGV